MFDKKNHNAQLAIRQKNAKKKCCSAIPWGRKNRRSESPQEPLKKKCFAVPGSLGASNRAVSGGLQGVSRRAKNKSPKHVSEAKSFPWMKKRDAKNAEYPGRSNGKTRGEKPRGGNSGERERQGSSRGVPRSLGESAERKSKSNRTS